MGGDRGTADRELARAEDAIEDATGVRPDGFRGPGYSLSPATQTFYEYLSLTFNGSGHGIVGAHS